MDVWGPFCTTFIAKHVNLPLPRRKREEEKGSCLSQERAQILHLRSSEVSCGGV